jgi:hypothetical protein
MVKKTKNLPQKEAGRLGRKRWIMLSAILIPIIFLGLVFSNSLLQPQVKFPLTAIIIDQLAADFPDPSFVSNVNSTLQNHGFKVSYYNETLDVHFFKNLASSDYGLIILRDHSALRNDSSTVDLFTSERYVPGVHDQDLSNGLLALGEYYYRPDELYFVLSSLFIENSPGRFPNSIVIAMGCQSLKQGCEQMAQAFLDKGAKAYIGWSDVVFPQDTDTETVRLMRMLLDENLTMGDAVRGTHTYTYSGTPSPYSNETINVKSEMRFYPQSEDPLTVSELTAETKGASNASMFASLGSLFVCLVADPTNTARIRRTLRIVSIRQARAYLGLRPQT